MGNNSHYRYDRHEEEWESILKDPTKRELADTWFRKDTLDAWRHQRMRQPIVPIISDDTSAHWLTVGDGRYGTDANFLLTSGAENVHCSDISDILLRIGNEKAFIGDYSAENAENLTFPDDSFDYVYCKESLHHFPRPYIALHEMFRVARSAVIITEPRDQLIDRAPFGFILSFAKAMLGKRPHGAHSFEPVGNYVYSMSQRELEKFLLGMHYTHIAYSGCNDYYIEGVERARFDGETPREKALAKKLFRMIKIRDALVRAGVMKSNIITAAVFKRAPREALIRSMKGTGWSFENLPCNPYV